MKNFFFIYAIAIFLTIISCKTVSKKVDAVSEEEKKKLSRFLNNSTDELNRILLRWLVVKVKFLFITTLNLKLNVKDGLRLKTQRLWAFHLKIVGNCKFRLCVC